MADIRDDRGYEDVIKILKGLPRVNASADFEINVKRRLNSEKYNEKSPWLQKIFTPSRLVPAAAAAAAMIVIFLFSTIETPQLDDPLSMEPQVREDVLSGNSADEYMSGRLSRGNTRELNAASNVGYIMKSGLNFRQVNLSPEEKIKLQRLKEKFKNWIRTYREQ